MIDLRAAISERIDHARAAHTAPQPETWPVPSLRSAVYDIIKRHGPITPKAIDRMLGFTAWQRGWPRCSAICGALYRGNLIRHPGKQRNGSAWEINTLDKP